MPGSGFGQNALVVDTRLLIAAHPLLKDYDSQFHRFRGTPSEPILGGVAGLEAFKMEIDRLETELKNSSSILQRTIQDSKPDSRIFQEKRFLEEKKSKEQLLNIMKNRLYLANILPGRPGFTPNNSIYPQVRQMLADIRNVLKKLQYKYSTSMVIDISGICPIIKNDNTVSPLLTQNLHFSFWGGGTARPETNSWIREAKEFWAKKEFGSFVVPYGGVDVRLESIKLLEEVKGRKP